MRVIKVQGRGQVEVEPDIVTLSFDVEARSKDYEGALKSLNARVDDLRGSINRSCVDKAKLRTSHFAVRIDSEYKDGRRIPVGYVASHQLHIELPVDKALLNKVLICIAEGRSGAQIGMVFSVKDQAALRKKALDKAVRTARENAETLASAAGVALGKLVQLDYGWEEVRIQHQSFTMDLMASSADAIKAPDIEPEEVSGEDSVTLVFEIQD